MKIQELSKAERLNMAMDAVRNGSSIKAAAKKFGFSRDHIRKSAIRLNIPLASRITSRPARRQYADAARGLGGDMRAIALAFARLCDHADANGGAPLDQHFAEADKASGIDTRSVWTSRWRVFYEDIRQWDAEESKHLPDWLRRATGGNWQRLSHFALAAMEVIGENEDGIDSVDAEIQMVKVQYLTIPGRRNDTEARRCGLKADRRFDPGEDLASSYDWEDDEDSCF